MMPHPSISNAPRSSSSKPSRFSSYFGAIVLIAITCMGCFIYDAEVTQETNTINLVSFKKKMISESTEAMIQEEGGDTKQRSLTELMAEERNNFFDRLAEGYGNDNFANMFFEHQSISGATNETDVEVVSRGRTVYTSQHGLSWVRLKRKFMIKILQAKINSQTGHQEQRRRRQQQGEKTRLVWATGGHSAAAGHGNFLDEAYTAVMERTMKPIFARFGIEFVARPYAMGGTSSAEEVALCIDQIFGKDIDVLSWDYGMMESKHQEWKQLLYTYHAALGKNRPAVVGIDMRGGGRSAILSELEQLGMTVLMEDFNVIKQIKEAIPDSQEMTDAEIDLMPPLSKKFRCGKFMEKGGVCGGEKYNKTACPKRPGRVSWHPGWKMHALTGNSISLFLIEVLMDAVQDLDAVVLSEKEDLQTLMDRYVTEEEKDYANLLTSPIPENLSKISNRILGSETEAPVFGNISLLELYKRKSFCHTALLPSQMRYEGLLTENRNQSNPAAYDMGIPQPSKGDPFDKNPGIMRLAYTPGERFPCPEGGLRIDFKDFFYLNSLEKTKKLILPNDVTKEYYGFDTSQMLGMVIMCLTTCEWGRCNLGDLRDNFQEGLLHMTVNGAAVTNFTRIDVCWALGKENEYQWTPNGEGKFEIEARVHNQGGHFGFLRFSSFILL